MGTATQGDGPQAANRDPQRWLWSRAPGRTDRLVQRDFPRELVAGALVVRSVAEYAHSLGLATMVAVLAKSTDYAREFRRIKMVPAGDRGLSRVAGHGNRRGRDEGRAPVP